MSWVLPTLEYILPFRFLSSKQRADTCMQKHIISLSSDGAKVLCTAKNFFYSNGNVQNKLYKKMLNMFTFRKANLDTIVNFEGTQTV